MKEQWWVGGEMAPTDLKRKNKKKPGWNLKSSSYIPKLEAEVEE